MVNAEAREFVQALPRLRSMPHVAQRILSVANNERTTTRQLAETVALDPAITLQLLRFANSSLYGPRNKQVRDLVTAIVVLGFEQAAELALASSVRDLEGDSAESKLEWRRTLLVATGASRLSRALLQNRGTQETFVAGMLHDIGKTALRMKNGVIFDQVFAPGVDDVEAYDRCVELLGCHPGEIGAALAEQWKLPPEIALVARYHHDDTVLMHDELRGEQAMLLWIVQGGKLIADSAMHRVKPGEGPTRLGKLLDVPQFRGNMASQYARAWYSTYKSIGTALTANYAMNG